MAAEQSGKTGHETNPRRRLGAVVGETEGKCGEGSIADEPDHEGEEN